MTSEQSIKVNKVNTCNILQNNPNGFIQYEQECVLSGGPRYMRCSMNSVGSEVKTVKGMNLPLGVVVHPFADPVENE